MASIFDIDFGKLPNGRRFRTVQATFKVISFWRDRGAFVTLCFQCAVYKLIYLLTYQSKAHIYDFLLVINTNLPPILHFFHVMADYWSNFR